MTAFVRMSRFIPFALLALAFTPRCAFADEEVVRLQRHGKTGDTFVYQWTRHEKGEILFSESQDASDTDETQTRVLVMRQRSVNKDGGLVVEISARSGKKDAMLQGKQTHSVLPAAAALYTFPNDLKTWSATPLPDKGDKPLSRSASKVILSELEDIYEPLPLPDKKLRIGESWDGVMPKNPYRPENKLDPALPYTATLVSIEKIQGVPCAKVVYTLQYTGDVPSIRESFEKAIATDSKVEGDVDLSGTITQYYSLDRGALMSGQMTFKTKFKYKVSVRIGETEYGRESNAEGELTTEERLTATQFPPYAPGLRPTDTTAGK